VPSSVFEAERALVYPVGVARRSSSFAGGAAAAPCGRARGIVAVDLYALGTRLLPDRLGAYDPSAPYRLAIPVGYWNGLGILSVMGVLLALALALRSRTAAARAVAAATLPVLLATLYFTYSRGSLLSLALALALVVALDPRRLQLVTVAAVVAAPGALGVWLASRSHALTTQGSSPPRRRTRDTGSRW